MLISSASMRAWEIGSIIGMDPDRVLVRGGRSNSISPPAKRNRWAKVLPVDPDRTEDVVQQMSAELTALGDEFASRVADLQRTTDCVASWSIWQKVYSPEEHVYLGMTITPAAIRWLELARASIDLDQYLDDRPLNQIPDEG